MQLRESEQEFGDLPHGAQERITREMQSRAAIGERVTLAVIDELLGWCRGG